MTVSDFIMVLAVLLAPLVAVQVQKYLEQRREHRQRRHYLFQTLMATRTPGTRVSHEHVRALNMIDLEFAEQRLFGRFMSLPPEKHVLEAWKEYQDHLNTPATANAGTNWLERTDDLFVELLYVMGHALGYEFDKVHLRKAVYSPKAHGDWELYQRVGQNWFVDLITGKAAIPIHVVEAPQSPTAEEVHRSAGRLLSQNIPDPKKQNEAPGI